MTEPGRHVALEPAAPGPYHVCAPPPLMTLRKEPPTP